MFPEHQEQEAALRVVDALLHDLEGGGQTDENTVGIVIEVLVVLHLGNFIKDKVILYD